MTTFRHAHACTHTHTRTSCRCTTFAFCCSCYCKSPHVATNKVESSYLYVSSVCISVRQHGFSRNIIICFFRPNVLSQATMSPRVTAPVISLFLLLRIVLLFSQRFFCYKTFGFDTFVRNANEKIFLFCNILFINVVNIKAFYLTLYFYCCY